MASHYTTTEYNRHKRIKGQIDSIFSHAIAFRLTHDAIVEKLSALYSSDDYKRQTAYYIGYSRGQIDAGFNDIWRNHVCWMLGPVTGPTRDSRELWTEEMSTLCRIPSALYGGHFWTDDNDQPTDRPFTAYACTNAAKETA